MALAGLSIVFIVKAAVALSLGSHPLLVPAGDLDDAYYYHFAQRVAAGDLWLEQRDSFFGETPAAFFLSPLYVYVLAFFLSVGNGSLQAVRLAQVALGTAAVGLLALTAVRWFDRRAAWAAGALAAGFGLFTFYEILILQAALDPFLSALTLYLLTRAVHAERRVASAWALTGAALGIHALNRPNMVIVLAGMALLLALSRRRLRWPDTRSRVLAAAAFVAAGALVIAPATLRNYRVTGDFVLISSHGGLNFLIGNGPEADGTYVRAMNIEPTVRAQWLDVGRVVREEIGRDPSPSEASAFFFRRAWNWISDHPAGELALLARKTWYALSATFLTLNHSYPFFARDQLTPLTFLLIGPALVVPLGIAGIALLRPREAGWWIWASYMPLSVLAVVAFFIAARYRLPYQAALCVPAGALAVSLLDTIRARDWAAVLRRAAVPALIAVPVLWPTGLDDGRAEEQTRLGLAEIQQGRAAAGDAWIARALERHGHPGIVHMRAGQVYESRGDTAEALRHYQAALSIDPGETSLQFVIGRTLVRQERYAEAIASLEQARRGPQRDAATRLLVLALVRQGRHDEANARVRELDPAQWNADQAREFALALAQAGRIDLSIAAWRRAADASGDAADYDRLGLSWAMLKRYPEAIATFSEAVKRNPRSAPIRLNYAVALASGGRIEDARREARAALAIEPSYTRAVEFLKSLR